MDCPPVTPLYCSPNVEPPVTELRTLCSLGIRR